MQELYALLIPDSLGFWSFWALLATSFTASFITVAFGIGGGAVLLAIMANLVPITMLIPLHGVIQIGSNAGRVILTWRDIYWPAFPMFAIGTLIGALVGGSLVVALPAAWVQIGIGSFILWTLIAQAPKFLRRWGAVTGFVSSFLTMFFGATGLFVVAYVKSFGLDRHRLIATHASFMTLQHAIKSLTFLGLGVVFAPWLPFIIAMIAMGFVGTLIGKQILMRISEQRFKLALNTILVLLSVRLIWSGLSSLLGF